MLAKTGLLEVVLPESRFAGRIAARSWERTLKILDALESPTFAMALAALIREIESLDQTARDLPRTIFERWKLSTDELEGVTQAAGRGVAAFARPARFPGRKLQRISDRPADRRAARLLRSRRPWGGRLDGRCRKSNSAARSWPCRRARAQSAAADHRRRPESRRHSARTAVPRSARRRPRCPAPGANRHPR